MLTPEGKIIALTGFVGALLGVGQMLASGEKVTWRVAVGRAIVSGGLGLAACAALMVFDQLPLPALVGLASILASLGTSAVERVLVTVMGRK